MNLSLDDVRHVAELAKLALTDEEIVQFAEQLSDILNYAERLQAVDTNHVAPTPYPLPLDNVFRDDEPGACLSNEDALSNAPDRADGYFRVKAYFDE